MKMFFSLQVSWIIAIKLHVYKGSIKLPSGRVEVLILGVTDLSSFEKLKTSGARM